MISDDLSTLFGPKPPGAAVNSQFRQGTILSFSTVDGSNTVGVGASVLTNVPMAMTGAEVNYVQGDPVLLLILGNTYMILCKVAMVGSSQFASASAHNASAQNSATGLTFASPFTRVITATVAIPSWANAASCVVVGSMTTLGGATSGVLQVNAGITGQPFNAPEGSTVPVAGLAGGTQGFAGVATGLTGGGTLQAETNGSCNVANSGGTATVSMMANFFKQ